MEIQQRINQQRIQHIIDSYLLAGHGQVADNDQVSRDGVSRDSVGRDLASGELASGDPASGDLASDVSDNGAHFYTYLSDLLTQYASGLIELALVETLAKSWLRVPMQKGLPFLSLAHERLKGWQQDHSEGRPLSSTLSPGQFSQITGLDAQAAFAALAQPVALSAQPAIE